MKRYINKSHLRGNGQGPEEKDKVSDSAKTVQKKIIVNQGSAKFSASTAKTVQVSTEEPFITSIEGLKSFVNNPSTNANRFLTRITTIYKTTTSGKKPEKYDENISEIIAADTQSKTPLYQPHVKVGLAVNGSGVLNIAGLRKVLNTSTERPIEEMLGWQGTNIVGVRFVPYSYLPYAGGSNVELAGVLKNASQCKSCTRARLKLCYIIEYMYK